MLLPQMLRTAMPKLRIGFFLHIPFPSSEIFRIFPKRTQMLTGVLGADVIGFHTLDFVRHFRTTLRRVLGVETGSSFCTVDGRKIRLFARPLGIDPVVWTQENEEIKTEMKQLYEAAKGRKIILGVERLDYTKGIPNRLQAFLELLNEDPSLVDKVMMIQVTVPSRTQAEEYAKLKDEIDRLAGEINSLHGLVGRAPYFGCLCGLYLHKN